MAFEGARWRAAAGRQARIAAVGCRHRLRGLPAVHRGQRHGPSEPRLSRHGLELLLVRLSLQILQQLLEKKKNTERGGEIETWVSSDKSRHILDNFY